MLPELSFVLPCYNKVPITTEFCREAIESIYHHTQKYSFEVIVVDNASPDHQMMTQETLRDLFDRATIVSLPENIGFGAACNLGFRLASGKYLVCMNTDAELVEDSASLLRDFADRENLAVAFPEHYENCKHYGMDKSDQLMDNWFFGAFWVGRRDIVVDQMHGFDPFFEMCYYEDTDLWSRIFQAGHRIAGWRGTWVKHHGNASAIPTINEHLLRNRQRYIERWGTDKVVKVHSSVDSLVGT